MKASMDTRAKLTRKTFFKIIAGLTTGSFLWIWYKLSNFQAEENNQSAFRHQSDIPQGVNHFGKYYLFHEGETMVAFSTACTHAGCQLGKTHSNVLQCSCHGSQFDAATGRPLKGPAIRPLRRLDCLYDDAANQWVVHLQPSAGINS